MEMEIEVKMEMEIEVKMEVKIEMETLTPASLRAGTWNSLCPQCRALVPTRSS